MRLDILRAVLLHTSFLLTHGVVSLGEESSAFGRTAVPSSW
jgi:hypothetical protein